MSKCAVCVCNWCVGAAESDYSIDSDNISCDSTFDISQPVAPRVADVRSHSVGKITFVQCSALSAESVADVAWDAAQGMCVA